MPTNRRTRAKRRNVSLQEYEIERLLLHGHDHFVARDVTDPDIRATLKAAWRDPAVKARVLARWQHFVENDGPHCWAAREFDGAKESAKDARARKARLHAKYVEYVVSCCADWQIDRLLTDKEKLQHAGRLAWRKSYCLPTEHPSDADKEPVSTIGRHPTRASGLTIGTPGAWDAPRQRDHRDRGRA